MLDIVSQRVKRSEVFFLKSFTQPPQCCWMINWILKWREKLKLEGKSEQNRVGRVEAIALLRSRRAWREKHSFRCLLLMLCVAVASFFLIKENVFVDKDHRVNISFLPFYPPTPSIAMFLLVVVVVTFFFGQFEADTARDYSRQMKEKDFKAARESSRLSQLARSLLRCAISSNFNFI